MSCDPYEWTCARCGKAWPDSYHVSYPRIFWKDNKKQTGDVCEECRNELDNKQSKEKIYSFGDWVIYAPGYKKEIGRVVEDRGKYVRVCYHKGCTAANTPKQHLRYATKAEIQTAPDNIGFHRFDSYCPVAKDCPLISKCQAWLNMNID